MANETDTGLIAHDLTAEASAALAAEPFDPATLLEAPPRRPSASLEGAEALPYATGPAAEVVHTFDPAVLLGDAARRGPATIGDGKPLVARIGGVEVVTIPLEHYAALLSPLALSRGSAEPEQATAAVDVEGALGLITRLLAEGTLSEGQVASATGLHRVEIRRREDAYNAMLADHAAVQTSIVRAEEPAPLDITSSPETTTVDLPPKVIEVPLTVADAAGAYDAAAQSGEMPGGAMDREGKPAEPTGKGEAAYDASRGSSKRSRR
jgi:hypothetical protein